MAVAISGGVDSLVAAYLLKKQKWPIVGINFTTGFECDMSISSIQIGLNKVSQKLNIPIEILDIRKEFKSSVVDYFIKTYCDGKTPNPCIVCNYKIKFDLLYSMARKIGASKIATGHYARIKNYMNKIFYLKEGIDRAKDQSYFLSRLKQKQLSNVLFPIGHMTKDQVKATALKNNLQPLNSRESQDICFIKNNKYIDFIEKHTTKTPIAGKIVDVNGKQLGTHKGLYHFTIGQRRGIDCPSNEPYYVIKIDKTNNCLIVGKKELLYSSTCHVKKIIWVPGNQKKTIRAKIRIRYHHIPSPATLIPNSKNSVFVRFDTPQRAITPGQVAVFYVKSKIIGSGWIE